YVKEKQDMPNMGFCPAFLIFLVCQSLFSRVHTSNASCNKSSSNVVAASITVVIEDFSRKVQSFHEFTFHCFWIDFFCVDASAGHKSFFDRQSTSSSKTKVF